MNEGIVFSSFKKQDINELYEAFTSAFSGNSVPFKPTLEQFENRILHKLNIAEDLSGLLLDDSKVVAFVLHTSLTDKGKTTAYNGGTGVIPDYRGHQYATKLYNWLLPQLKAAGINNILLEVIEGNHSAMKVYKDIGFQFRRKLKCYITREPIATATMSEAISICECASWKNEYVEMESYESAYLDSIPLLTQNLNSEIILEAWMNEKLCGYVVFQPSLGRISRIAVHPDYRGRGIGRNLIGEVWKRSNNGEVSVMNVPQDEFATISALEHIGFINEIDQFEMELII